MSANKSRAARLASRSSTMPSKYAPGRDMVKLPLLTRSAKNENDDTSPENLQTIEAETTRLRNETAAYKAQEKDLRAELREDAGRISLPELKASIAELEGDKAELIARLTKVKSGDVKPVHAEERTRINDEHRKWQKIAAARSKIRAELWKEIASIVGSGKAEDTKEELGLEF